MKLFKSLIIGFGIIVGTIRTSNAQTYTPSAHTVVSKPIGIPKGSTDARSQFYDATHFVYRDYVNTAEVLSYLSTSNFRSGKFTIYVNVGGTLNGSTGVITGGVVNEYWFKDGTADLNLTLKTSASSGITSFNSRTGAVVLTGTDVSTALGFSPLSSLYTGFDTRYQPLEDQRLSTTDTVTFKRVIVNGDGMFTGALQGHSIEGTLQVPIGIGAPISSVTMADPFTDSNPVFGARMENTDNYYNVWFLMGDSPVSGAHTFNTYRLSLPKPASGNGTLALTSDISALSTVYQPLENQRLSTTNSPTFGATTVNGQLAATVTSSNIASILSVSGATINNTETLLWYNIRNTVGGSDIWQINGKSVASGITNDYVLSLPRANGTFALITDVAAARIVTHNDLAPTQTVSATILTYNVPTTSVFEIGTYLSITAISSSTDGTTVTYTDENNNTTTTPLIVNAFAAGQYSLSEIIRAKAGTVITLSTSIVGGTVTYGAGGYVELKY